MNRAQKIAWFNLAVIAGCIALSAGMTIRFAFQHGFPSAFGGMGFLGFACLIALGPLLFRKKKGQVDFDERDLIIERQSDVASFGACFAFFIVVFVAMWLTMGMDRLIPLHWLGGILLGGWVTAIIAGAVTTLVFYGRGKGEKS